MCRPSPRSIRLRASTLIALVLLAAHRVEAASMYGVTDFGANAYSLRLNNPGQVAGLRSSGDGNSKGFLYTAGADTDLAGGVVPISLTDDGRAIDARGPFPFYGSQGSNPGYFNQISPRDQIEVSNGAAGNHLGTLVGMLYYTPYAPQDFTRVEAPYIYTPGPPGTPVNEAFVRDRTSVYGYSVADAIRNGSFFPGDPIGRGTESRLDLPDNVQPTGINDTGQIVGTRRSADLIYPPPFPGSPKPTYDTRAYLGKQDLGTLGGVNSLATAINNAGQVTGQADTASGVGHAFLYTGGKMVDLGLLPGTDFSRGLGLNEKGDVVGVSGGKPANYGGLHDAFTGGHAFLYHAATGIMEDLNDRLPATSGLTLDKAIAINDAGQILAYGHGADGVEHGLLLSPVPTPEPSALAVLGLASAGFGVWRLRNPRG